VVKCTSALLVAEVHFYMSGIDSLSKLFEEFPGIGPRQAKRFVYFLLRADSGYRQQLIDDMRTLAAGIARCSLCHRYMPKSGDMCSICTSSMRDTSLCMVVLKDADVESIEAAGVYNGLYFVLGTLVKLTENEAPARVVSRIKERLVAKIRHTHKDGSENETKECICALPVTTDGEHTQALLLESLHPFLAEHSIRLTTLGRGLSTGSELEYADTATLRSAFEKRN
jgi:recombination protein RecR